MISLRQYSPSSESYTGVVATPRSGETSSSSRPTSRQSPLELFGFGPSANMVALEINGETNTYNVDMIRTVQKLVALSIPFNSAADLLSADFLTSLNALTALNVSLSRRAIADSVPAAVALLRQETRNKLARSGLASAPYTLMFDESSSYKYGILNVLALFAGDRSLLVNTMVMDARAATSAVLAERVTSGLAEYSLTLGNCVATSSDNGRNAAGVVAVLRRDNPGLVGITCIAHSVQLMMKAFLMEPGTKSGFSIPFPEVRELLLCIRKTFTKGSRSERIVLERAVSAARGSLNFVQSRWNSVREALRVLVEKRAELFGAVSDLRGAADDASTDESWKTCMDRILELLGNLEVDVMARVALWLTAGMDTITVTAQSSSPDLITIYDDLVKVKEKLESLMGPAARRIFAGHYEQIVALSYEGSTLPPPMASDKMLGLFQPAVARALDRFDRNVLPSLAPMLFRVILEPHLLARLVVGRRFDEILLAIDSSAPAMTERERRQAESHQRQIETMARKRAEVIEKKKRKKAQERRGRKKLRPSPSSSSSLSSLSSPSSSLQRQGVVNGNDGDDDDNDDDGDDDDDDGEAGDDGNGESEIEEVHVGVIGRRRVFFNGSRVPPFPSTLFAQFDALAGFLSESSLLSLMDEWKKYVSCCVFQFWPQHCLYRNDDGTIGHPRADAGSGVSSSDAFWDIESSRFPVLSSIASRVRTLPVSTAEVERTFNCLKDILRDNRKGAMNEETLENEMFIKISSSFNKI